MTEYAERDSRKLDRMGNYYCKHIEAMTTEGLHSKAAIAGELAYRDARIDQLEKVMKEFCYRVEIGAVRSVTTYSKFREVLGTQVAE